MPSWKKVITSGSNANLNQITASAFQFVGSGTAQLEVQGHITASGNISASITSTGSFGTLHLEGSNFSSSSLASAIAGGGGSFNNFTLTADAGSNQTIADGNTLDIAGGTNITTAVGATDTVTVNLDASPSVTHITASGNISASGDFIGDELQIDNGSSIYFAKDTTNEVRVRGVNNFLQFRSGSAGADITAFINITTGDFNTKGNITASGNISSSGNLHATGDFILGNFTDGAYISASSGNIEISGSGRGQLEVDYRLFDTGSINTTVHDTGASVGDIVKFGGTSTSKGTVYYLKADGTWAQTDADFGYSSGSLAVALGANSTTHGMLLRGIAAMDHTVGGVIGSPLYLSTTAGRVTNTPPGSADFARVVGFRISGSAGIYFNPDNTTIKVA